MIVQSIEIHKNVQGVLGVYDRSPTVFKNHKHLAFGKILENPEREHLISRQPSQFRLALQAREQDRTISQMIRYICFSWNNRFKSEHMEVLNRLKTAPSTQTNETLKPTAPENWRSTISIRGSNFFGRENSKRRDTTAKIEKENLGLQLADLSNREYLKSLDGTSDMYLDFPHAF